MKSKRYIWHPATVFFLLACLVVFLSWISEVYGMNIVRSETGEVIRVRSLLSPEGLRWLLRHVVENYVEFRALGPVLLVVAGVSVCLHSGCLIAIGQANAANCHAKSGGLYRIPSW